MGSSDGYGMHGQYPVSVVSRDLFPHDRFRDGETSTKPPIVAFGAFKGLPYWFSRDTEETSIQHHAYLIPLDSGQSNFDNKLACALNDIGGGPPNRLCRSAP